MNTVATILFAVALGSLLVFRIKRMLSEAEEHHGPQSLFARVQRILETRQAQSPDNPAYEEMRRDAEAEFAVGLIEYGRNPAEYRLEFRNDDLLGLVPWVVDSTGAARELSAFEASLRRRPGLG